VADETVSLLLDQSRRARVREGLRTVRAKLGAPGASERAARLIVSVARAQAVGSTA